MDAYALFARVKEAIVRCEEDDDDIGCPSSGSSSASDEVELADDASSSGSTTGHFEMASLMTQLPIKRGLSKFFDGKSQSFASLAVVAGLEDLPKPSAKRLKASASCGVGLKDAHRGRRLSAAAKKAAVSRARPRKLVMRTQPPVTARPGAVAVAGQPLVFA